MPGIKMFTHPANMILDGQKFLSLGYSAFLKISSAEHMLRILYVKEFEVKLSEKLKRRVTDQNLSFIM